MAVIERKAYMNICVCLYVHISKIKRNSKIFFQELRETWLKVTAYKERHELSYPILPLQHVSGITEMLKKALDFEGIWI